MKGVLDIQNESSKSSFGHIQEEKPIEGIESKNNKNDSIEKSKFTSLKEEPYKNSLSNTDILKKKSSKLLNVVNNSIILEEPEDGINPSTNDVIEKMYSNPVYKRSVSSIRLIQNFNNSNKSKVDDIIKEEETNANSNTIQNNETVEEVPNENNNDGQQIVIKDEVEEEIHEIVCDDAHPNEQIQALNKVATEVKRSNVEEKEELVVEEVHMNEFVDTYEGGKYI